MLKFTDPILAEWEKTVCEETLRRLGDTKTSLDAAGALIVAVGMMEGRKHHKGTSDDTLRLRDTIGKELEQARELRAKYAELEAKYAATQEAAGLAGNRNIELGRENAELLKLLRLVEGRGDEYQASPCCPVCFAQAHIETFQVEKHELNCRLARALGVKVDD